MKPTLILALLIAAPGAEAWAQLDGVPLHAARVVLDEYHRFDRVLDWSGDGKPDAVGAWWTPAGAGALVVTGYLGDGSGSLAPHWTIPLNVVSTGWPIDVAVADFDGDDAADFAVQVAQRVYLFQSAGLLEPQLIADWIEGGQVSGFTAGNFAGDARSELAIVRQFAANLVEFRIYESPAPGAPFALRSAVQLPAGTIYGGLRAVDLDGDGYDDAIGGTGNVLGLFKIIGGTATQGLLYTVSGNILGRVAGDIDGDGHLELVAFSTGGYKVLQQISPGNYVAGPLTAGGPATELCDIDGDGDLDGICCGGGGTVDIVLDERSDFEIALNDGTGSFAAAFAFQGVGSKHIAGATDLDRDGDLDLVAGRCVYYGRGAWAVDPQPQIALATGAPPRAWRDLDDDGDLDLYVEGAATYRRNPGTGILAATPRQVPAAPAGTIFSGPTAAVDADGDGDLDLVVHKFTPSFVFIEAHLLRNAGGGHYADAGPCAPAGLKLVPPTGQTGDFYRSIAADLDGDGDQDFVSTPDADLVTLVAMNDGTGNFTLGSQVNRGTLAVVDLNGDSFLDLGLRNGYALGLGAGAFAPIASYGFEGELFGHQQYADFDGDGDIDFAASESDDGVLGRVWLAVNDGSANFALSDAFAGLGLLTSEATQPRSVFAVDLDGDGLLDTVRYPAHKPTSLPASVALVNLRSADNSGYEPTIRLAFDPSAFVDADGDGDLDVAGVDWFENVRFDGPSAGERRQYGTASVGGGGAAATLGAAGVLRPGETVEVRLRGSAGATFGTLMVGFAESALLNKPYPGLAYYAFPIAVALPLPVAGSAAVPGSGEWTIPFAVPAAAAGATLFLQFFTADPGTPFGASCTNGLELSFGT